VELHGVLGSDPCAGVEGDQGLLGEQIRGIVDEISHLEVEEALALVAVNVRLVTVVAEALAVPLSHLR
jgi:hypothetical protein